MKFKKRYISIFKNEILKELNKDYLANREYFSDPGFPNLVYIKTNKAIFLKLVRERSFRNFICSYLRKIDSNLIISTSMKRYILQPDGKFYIKKPVVNNSTVYWEEFIIFNEN